MSSIAFGCVRINRSLLPLISRWKSAKRSPRNAASSYCRPWIMVPMAPSSTKMRSRAAASRAVRFGETLGEILAVIGSSGLLCAIGANAQEMADRKHEVRAVHGVEMKGVDAVLGELLHLAGRDGGGNELARLGVVVEAFELVRQPVRHGGARAGHEVPRLLEIVHRHDAGDDRDIDAAGANAIEIAEVEVVIEEHLRDGTRRAGVDLGLQRVDVGIDGRALRMLLRIGRNRDFDIGIALLDAFDQVGRTLIAVRMGM